MAQSIAKDADRTTAAEWTDQADAVLDGLRPRLRDWLRRMSGTLDPATFQECEVELHDTLRECGRSVMEMAVNQRAEQCASAPPEVVYEGQRYRRLARKTRHATVASLFGVICVWRYAYRFTHPWVKESCIFPLELQLGLIEGATPALADSIGRRMAEAGATQRRVIAQLRKEHGVPLGVKRLRNIVSALSEGVEEHRQATQVKALVQALQTASASPGNRKPVLAVGRDGITLCEYRYRYWEVATAATVSVYDRAGKRLLTVYLAYRPELGQATMSRMLSDLVRQVLLEWSGPPPTLAYVADSGGNESSYFEDALARMRPPAAGERLRWERVVDFYHAATRVWSMGEALFGVASQRGRRWVERMLHLLKNKPRGAKRVLHSAASLSRQSGLSKTRLGELRRACNYIRKRTKWMRYSEYKRRHIPLGSGVTEAACKTIYTQRLKLSGMRWKPDHAQRILTLRTVLLSGVWDHAYRALLVSKSLAVSQSYGVQPRDNHAIAA